MMKLTEIRPSVGNPRQITKDKLAKLKKSISEFGKMMELRPIVVDTDGNILGGNMRYRAIKALGYTEIPNNWVKVADGLTEEEKRRFVIEDNVAFGDWDYDVLAEWSDLPLVEWGVDFRNVTETERLSRGIGEIDSIYFVPSEDDCPPELSVCYDYSITNKKIDELRRIKGLTEEDLQALKPLIDRFVRIDFESVANYYFFKASAPMRRAIELLRAVWCDAGVDGFIEDDLLRLRELNIMEFIEND